MDTPLLAAGLFIYQFVRLNLEAATIEEIKRIIEPLISCYVFEKLPTSDVFGDIRRIRNFEDREKPKHFDEIVQPKEPAKEDQRLNRAGELPFFYAANNPNCAMHEINPEEGDSFIEARWKTTKPLMLIPTAISKVYAGEEKRIKLAPDDYMKKMVAIPGVEDIIESFLADQFTLKEEDSPFCYKASIAIAESLDSDDMDGFMYPSIKLDGNGLNIAIKPGFINNGFLQLDYVNYWHVRKKEGYRFTVEKLDEAFSLMPGKAIHWEGLSLKR